MDAASRRIALTLEVAGRDVLKLFRALLQTGRRSPTTGQCKGQGNVMQLDWPRLCCRYGRLPNFASFEQEQKRSENLWRRQKQPVSMRTVSRASLFCTFDLYLAHFST